MKLLETGQKAPDFSVKDHTGKQVSLSDFSGQHVILWFYPKAATPG
jgi:thioredoxin-dependent peroxiredoxin